MTVSRSSARAGASATPARADLEAIWPYVPGRHRVEIEREYGIANVLKVASNENPLGPSPRALAALAALDELQYYPDSQARDLKEALAARHGVEPDHVVVGNGSVECIDLVARAFLRPGDEAICGFPCFPRFPIACQVIGVAPVVVPHVDWTVDLDGIAGAVTERTRVVYIDNPCNPTGTHVAPDDLAAFLDALPPRVLVLLDRAYYEFVPPGERFEEDVERILGGENLAVLRTFSKAYGLAGLRIGYALARPDHVRALDRVREAFNTSVVAQAAGMAAIEDDAHVEATLRVNEAGRTRLLEAFDRQGFAAVPSKTNFLFVDLGERAAAINGSLLSKGIVIRPMTAPGIDTFARISVPDRAGVERLVSALGEIGA
ncbi:MAG: histidinol-phosphate transaminase [Gemmatimonadetes bacterium]|nr:histidinol-phosphate transaminase [Gemmatimonadota bacterium]